MQRNSIKLPKTSIYKNREDLTQGELSKLRSHMLDILEAGVGGGDPGQGTRAKVFREGNRLTIDGNMFDLECFDQVYFVGSGKGSLPIAQALEEILGERLTQGIMVAKRGEIRRLQRIDVIQAGHPIPDGDSIKGAQRILELADQAGPDDLVLAAITGGCSSLTTLPPSGISLAEIQELSDMLLKSGAVIGEVNTVRRHLCQLKGGRLVQRIQPAMAVTFTLDTAPAGMPWPDMSLPDPSTFRSAIEVLRAYSLFEQVPRPIRDYLVEGLNHPERETVKSLLGMRTQMVMVGNPANMCQAAAEKARELGYGDVILSTHLEGESKEAGILLTGIAHEIINNNRPFNTPCALISGGETTVTINGKSGAGGPNQEFALAFAAKMSGEEPWAFAALDSDGTDGPTDIAGGLVDSLSAAAALGYGLDLARCLREHNSSQALKCLNGAIITGHTGTNLQNLRVLLIP